MFWYAVLKRAMIIMTALTYLPLHVISPLHRKLVMTEAHKDYQPYGLLVLHFHPPTSQSSVTDSPFDF